MMREAAMPKCFSPSKVKEHECEAIADITSSGQTLKANHLKILHDGLMLESQATLFYAKQHNLDQKRAQALAQFIDSLGL
jgi:ATP phosphoribosyltransferase